MGFGISPDTLALRPSTLIQDRAGRESRAQQALQYERSRQDSTDRFNQSMASQEEQRKARFAEIEFLEEQKLTRERAKIEAKLLSDVAKEDKAKQKKKEDWVNYQLNKAISLGNIDWDNAGQAKEYFGTKYDELYSGQAGQVQQPPQQQSPQQAGTGAEEAALEQEVNRMGQAEQQVPQQEWQGVPYPMPEQVPQQAPMQQPQITQAPAPAKEEIPEAVIKTRFAPEYRKKNNQIKNTTKTITRLDKQEAQLEKLISGKGFINKHKYKADLEKLKTRIEKLRGKVSDWDDEKIKIVQDARKESEDKQKKPKRSKEYKNALNLASKAFNDFKDAEDFEEKRTYILQKLRLSFPEHSSEINRVFGESDGL